MKHTLIVLSVMAMLIILMSSGAPTQQSYYRYTPAPDTLMLGSNDTLVFIDRSNNTRDFLELYSYNITLKATQVGDTASTIIAILQETNEHLGSDWYELERDTVATGATIRLHGGSNTALGYVKGHNLRMILDDVGASGADTTLYELDVFLKKD